jgi:hypothetical protein
MKSDVIRDETTFAQAGISQADPDRMEGDGSLAYFQFLLFGLVFCFWGWVVLTARLTELAMGLFGLGIVLLSLFAYAAVPIFIGWALGFLFNWQEPGEEI